MLLLKPVTVTVTVHYTVTGLSLLPQAQVVAKYISDYNIKAIKFSPYEAGRLMTCGKDSIRMFRLKVISSACFVCQCC